MKIYFPFLLSIITLTALVRADGLTTSDLQQIERSRVITAADAYLKEKPDTITTHPVPDEIRPPNATPHDFYSEGDYYNPDPANPTATYIGRDGYSNPTMFMDHRRPLWRFDIQVPALVSAYLLTNDQQYADHAITHLRAWFITPDTRMNPNMDYAQVRRYLNAQRTGNVFGVIDFLHLVEVARSVVILRQHHRLTPEDDTAITQWFAEMIHWMHTAPNGIKEGNSSNNHAAAFWLQISAFAQVTNDPKELDLARDHFKNHLLPMMDGDGKFPREYARTKPYGYSLFQLDLMTMLAQVLSTPDDNLWEYSLPNGRNLRLATEFMYPFVIDKSKWPLKPDVMYYDQYPVRSCSWLYAGRAFNDPKYLDLYKSLPANTTNEEVLRNLPIRQPLLWE